MNSCVCVTKPNGKRQLCLDPKDLNKAIKRPHHYTQTLDDVLRKLSGAHFFTTLDARSGYWNIKDALYRIWCGANRLGDSHCGVYTFGDNSAFVNQAGQLLLTRRGKTIMDTVGIVFEFY